MLFTFSASGRKFEFHSEEYFDLSLPLDFQGEQPNAFDVPRATARPYRMGDQPLDTREGASCNCDVYTLNVHCNSTHTEGVGHITDERLPVISLLHETLIPTTLITISPSSLSIQREELERELHDASHAFLQGVVIRTLPNPSHKNCKTAVTPSYFTREAVEYLVELEVRHLVTDLPSLDAPTDTFLEAHHAFWGLPVGSKSSGEVERKGATVTELISIPDHIEDGPYLMNLQVASFKTDASPSRPILFPIKEIYGKQ